MKRHVGQCVLTATRVCTLLVAAASPLAADADDDGPPQFSDWSAPVNLGPPVSALSTGAPPVGAELNPFISRNGLSLYFGSDRLGGYGGFDIWVSHRASVDEPWGLPENLGPSVNSPSTENSPVLSLNGRRLYFQSDRPGGFGSVDLYVSERRHKRDDLSWQPATNLGSNVNTSFSENGAALFEDDEEETTTLYFASNRPGGPGSGDIYASTLNDDDEDETFEPAVLVPELSTPENEGGLVIRRDGLEVIQTSNRAGSIGGNDLWVATRACTSDAWSPSVNLGPVVNTTFQENRPALSGKGTDLYFASNRPSPGGFDIYVSTRTKVKESDDD